MKNYLTELQKERKINQQITTIENTIKTLKYSELANYTDMQKLPLLKIEKSILHDNARMLLFLQVIENLKEVLKKYNGKQYGEQTRKKINEEMKKRINCHVYISEENYCSTISICLLNKEGYSSYIFKYDELKSTEWNERKLLQNNKINLATLDYYTKLDYCQEYEEKPKQKAKTIIKQYNKVKQLQEELKKAINTLDDIKPSNYASLYSVDISKHWYF